MGLTLVLAGFSLAIITTSSLDGHDLDLMYWLAPAFSSAAAAVILATYVFYRSKINSWQDRLGLKTVTESVVATKNLASGNHAHDYWQCSEHFPQSGSAAVLVSSGAGHSATLR